MFTIRYWQKELPFEYPFTISKGTKTHQHTFIVELNFRGIIGYGEAPAIAYYGITTDQMVTDLESKRKFIESFSLTDPKRFWHFLHHLFPNNPFLVCALDMAGWDIYGKLRRKPLYELWNLNLANAPKTDYTIGIDSLEKMLEKINAHPAPIYKIKVGTSEDLEKLKAIRQHTNAIIRVDANAGWTFDQAMQIVPVLEKLNIELIEQPLAKEDFEGIKMLRATTSIPIFADESCVGERDVEKCAGYFSGINIKLTKCSGITPAMEMIKKARSLNLQVMLGCMNESSIGTAPLAHLAPLVDFLDADGPLLLTDNLGAGIDFIDYKLKPSMLPGLGINPMLDSL
ncbi:MAG: dipeptide epimerase [Chitinophagaceae bacterium]|nr:dipeptide epimerase [Chitinophagaceae bacterium]